MNSRTVSAMPECCGLWLALSELGYRRHKACKVSASETGLLLNFGAVQSIAGTTESSALGYRPHKVCKLFATGIGQWIIDLNF